jgi:hypothetical protein
MTEIFGTAAKQLGEQKFGTDSLYIISQADFALFCSVHQHKIYFIHRVQYSEAYVEIFLLRIPVVNV